MRYMKKSLLIGFTLIGITLLLSGCGARTNSLKIKSLENSNVSAYEFLKHANAWIEVDTTSKNYTKWKEENFANKTFKISEIDRCFEENMWKSVPGNGSKMLAKFNSCTKQGGWRIYYSEDSVIGFLETVKVYPKKVGNKIYENYNFFKIGIIENGTKAEIISTNSFRWIADANDTSFWKRLESKEDSYVKKLIKSLNKYDVKYTEIKQILKKDNKRLRSILSDS